MSPFLVAPYFWLWPSSPVMWNWTSSTVKSWRTPPMWWGSSEGVWSQVRLVTQVNNQPFTTICFQLESLCSVCVFVSADRYVIYGNHRDSWVHGAIDPSSGTSVMLELTRVLGKMVKQGEDSRSWISYFCLMCLIKSSSLFFSVKGKWRPRRSIIFGSWGAEEFGLIGSAEYTEVGNAIIPPLFMHS